MAIITDPDVPPEWNELESTEQKWRPLSGLATVRHFYDPIPKPEHEAAIALLQNKITNLEKEVALLAKELKIRKGEVRHWERSTNDAISQLLFLQKERDDLLEDNARLRRSLVSALGGDTVKRRVTVRNSANQKRIDTGVGDDF